MAKTRCVCASVNSHMGSIQSFAQHICAICQAYVKISIRLHGVRIRTRLGDRHEFESSGSDSPCMMAGDHFATL